MQSGKNIKTSDGRGFTSLAAFILICLAISAAGAAVTVTGVDAWYATLTKPSFNPPNWIFGPVWTILYLCIAVAGWRAWRSSGGHKRRQAMAVYAAQLGLNLAWSFLFFGLHTIGLALIDIAALLLVIVANVVVFWRIDRLAGACLAPYAAWVAFAAVLNAAIWSMN